MSSDKQYYDSDLSDDISWDWVNVVRRYVEPWATDSSVFTKSGMKVLELGAGSCTTSSIISKNANVASITACDISAKRMAHMAKKICDGVDGEYDKITFVEADFNEKFPFADHAFDLVIMDAALHHSRNIWLTLSEIRRVLDKNGTFVAQREAYTSPLTHKITFDRLLRSPEAAAQVSENAYLVSQYDYYLRVHGFSPKFIPVYQDWKFRALSFLNGLAFSKYNIIAKVV